MAGTVYHSEFLEKEGYWFDICKESDGRFSIFNTQRKRDQITRDGIGYYISVDPFNTLEEAKKYLLTLKS
jgi:hypothetical protein